MLIENQINPEAINRTRMIIPNDIVSLVIGKGKSEKERPIFVSFYSCRETWRERVDGRECPKMTLCALSNLPALCRSDNSSNIFFAFSHYFPSSLISFH